MVGDYSTTAAAAVVKTRLFERREGRQRRGTMANKCRASGFFGR